MTLDTLRDLIERVIPSPDASFFVPGRIEVLGKHTDYAGGRSLVCATDRGIVVSVSRRVDATVRMIDALTGEEHSSTAWGTYPRAVLRRCGTNFASSARCGADIVFASNLPQAAGLSSSSALVIATFLALDAVRDLSSTAEYRAAITSTEDLAGYLAAVENGLSFGLLHGADGVGTMGGSQDHTAILCARRGRLVQYRYSPVRFEADVAVPADHVFVIASSGVRAEKAGAVLEKYNRLSRMVQQLVKLWRDAGAGNETTLAAIIASRNDAAMKLRELVWHHAPHDAPDLIDRLDQFVEESTRIVPAAVAALAISDVRAFGDLCSRSQQLAEDLLRNQVPETVHLAESARELGAVASSAFGAGFGGSVWALVRTAEADAFTAAWRASYASTFGDQTDAVFLTARAGSPAGALPASRIGTPLP